MLVYTKYIPIATSPYVSVARGTALLLPLCYCHAILTPPRPHYAHFSGNMAVKYGEGPTADEVEAADEEAETDAEPDFPEVTDATYLGCFQDMRGDRTMSFAYVNNDDLTNEVRCGWICVMGWIVRRRRCRSPPLLLLLLVDSGRCAPYGRLMSDLYI